MLSVVGAKLYRFLAAKKRDFERQKRHEIDPKCTRNVQQVRSKYDRNAAKKIRSVSSVFGAYLGSTSSAFRTRSGAFWNLKVTFINKAWNSYPARDAGANCCLEPTEKRAGFVARSGFGRMLAGDGAETVRPYTLRLKLFLNATNLSDWGHRNYCFLTGLAGLKNRGIFAVLRVAKQFNAELAVRLFDCFLLRANPQVRSNRQGRSYS